MKSHTFFKWLSFFFLLHSVPASQTSVDDVSSKTLTFHLCICICVCKTRGCFNCTFCSCSLLRWVWSVVCVCVCVTHQSQRWPLVSCVLCKNLSEIKTINKEIILSSWLALTEIILLHSTCTVHEHTHTHGHRKVLVEYLQIEMTLKKIYFKNELWRRSVIKTQTHNRNQSCNVW